MSIQLEWTPSRKTGYFKILHTSGATYTTLLSEQDLDEPSFRMLLNALDEEVIRKTTPESYQTAFKDHPLSLDSRPRARAAGTRHSLSANLLDRGRRLRRHSGHR